MAHDLSGVKPAFTPNHGPGLCPHHPPERHNAKRLKNFLYDIV